MSDKLLKKDAVFSEKNKLMKIKIKIIIKNHFSINIKIWMMNKLMIEKAKLIFLHQNKVLHFHQCMVKKIKF